MCIYVDWPGKKKRKIHPEVPETIFVGKAVLFNTSKQSMPVQFQIPAVTIHQAVQQFDDMLKEVLKDLNKPKIEVPNGPLPPMPPMPPKRG